MTPTTSGKCIREITSAARLKRSTLNCRPFWKISHIDRQEGDLGLLLSENRGFINENSTVKRPLRQ